jgi:mitogen-activated protein kinase 15
LINARKKSHKNDYFPHIDANCMDLIKKTLEFDPSKRINILEILQHPYLSEFYNKK